MLLMEMRTMTGNADNKRSLAGWVWGFMLLLVGAIFLALNMGLIRLEGAITLPLVAGGVAILALPLLIAWLINRDQWALLLPAWVFLSLAVILVIVWLQPVDPQVIPMAILVQIAIPFLVTYLANRQRWWALIPAYALLALAAVIALTMLQTPETMLGGVTLILVALPFWWLYIRNRNRWWALIPAGGLSVIALPTIFLSGQQLGGHVEFIVFTGLLAIFFVIVWITHRKLDWALWIAGGFVVSIGLSFIRPEFLQSWPVVLLALGAYVVSRQIVGRRAKKAPPTPPTAAPQAGKPPLEALETPPEAPPVRPAEGVTFRPLNIPPQEPPKD